MVTMRGCLRGRFFSGFLVGEKKKTFKAFRKSIISSVIY